jgi:hypothetical protein
MMGVSLTEVDLQNITLRTFQDNLIQPSHPSVYTPVKLPTMISNNDNVDTVV